MAHRSKQILDSHGPLAYKRAVLYNEGMDKFKKLLDEALHGKRKRIDRRIARKKLKEKDRESFTNFTQQEAQPSKEA